MEPPPTVMEPPPTVEGEIVDRPKFAWSYVAVGHPIKAVCLVLCVPVICLVVIFATGSFSLAPFELADFFVADDVRTKRFHARNAALQQYPYDIADRDGRPPRSVIENRNSVILVLRSTRAGSRNPFRPARYSTTTASGNVLTPEGLALMKKAEDTVTGLKNYNRFCYNDNSQDCNNRVRRCALPVSLSQHPMLYGQWDAEQGKVCLKRDSRPVEIKRFGTFLATMFPDVILNSSGTQTIIRDQGITQQQLNELPLDKLREMKFAVGLDFTETNPTSQIMRSRIRFGSPVDNLSPDQLEASFRNWATKTMLPAVRRLSNAQFHVQAVSIALVRPLITNAAKRDSLFALGSLFLVFLVVSVHTNSIFLAMVTLLQILLAFPLTFVVYRFIFQVKYTGVLNITTLFLLLGIGADDVFVFTDTWYQAGEKLGTSCTLVDRMIYTYRRAVKAMTLTTFTTSIAFLTTMTSPIMPINTLGAWAAMLVLVQFLLVITIYPCALIIHHQRFAGRSVLNKFKKTDGDEEEQRYETVPTQPVLLTTHSKMTAVKNITSLLSGRTPEGTKFRPIEQFFNKKWTKWMHAARFPLIVVATALLIASIVFTARLRPPVEQEQILPQSNPMYSALLLQTSAFPAVEEGQTITVHVQWGVKNSNRTGISRFNPTEPGEAVVDPNFSLKTAYAQNRVLEACDFFSRTLGSKDDNLKKLSRCWMRDFMEWRESKNQPAFVNYANETALAQEVLAFGKAVIDRAQPYLIHLTSGRIGLSANQDRVLFTSITVSTDLPPFGPLSVVEKAYRKWENEVKKFNSQTREAAMKNAFASGGRSWAWTRTQKALFDAAVSGLGIMLAVAMASLTISTGNFVVAFLGLVCISSILLNILAFIYLIGFAIGIAESICIVVAVGFSFDYVAHLVTAYAESGEQERYERTRDALTELGISVIAGATSTLLAGCMLFFASIVLLFKFGTLVVATIVVSVVWSLIFLPAILHTVGPEGRTGKISNFFPCLWRRENKNNNNNNPDVAPVTPPADENQTTQ